MNVARSAPSAASMDSNASSHKRVSPLPQSDRLPEQAGETIDIPVAHHDGNYFADDETLKRVEGEGRIAFRYADAVNGSARNIAGVLNGAGNVLGMMPHPERAIDRAHGGTDGLRLFEAALGVIA